MAPPVPNPANVIVGPAYIYTAVSNTALVADTVDYGTIWPSPWAYAGATEAGGAFSSNVNTQDYNIDEQPNPAAVGLTSVDYRLDTVLAEDLIEKLNLALGHGAVTVVAAASSIIGSKEWNPGLTLNQYAVGMEGVNTFGFWRRFYFAVAVSVASPAPSYRRAAGPRMFTTQFRAICPPTGIRIREKTAAALP